MIDRIHCGVLLALALAVIPAAAAQEEPAGGDSPASSGQQNRESAGRKPGAGMHPLAQAVMQAGAETCARKVHEAGIYLTLDTKSGAISHFRSDDLYTFSLEVTDAAGLTSYVSLNVAPGKDDACAMSYEIVTPSDKSCETLWKEALGDEGSAPALHDRIKRLLVRNGPHVFLLPAGKGCIEIRKEVIP